MAAGVPRDPGVLSWFGLGITIALLPGLANGTEPQAESAATETPRISVNVDLVVLLPIVRNRGGYVAGGVGGAT